MMHWVKGTVLWNLSKFKQWGAATKLSKHEKQRKHITHTKGGTDGQMWTTLKQITIVGFENLLLFWAVSICSFSILRNSQLESDVAICRIHES